SVPLAGAAQIFERAAATAAEAKIVADDDVTCAEPRDEHLLDERPRLESAELAKARAEELVDTGGVEQLEALPEAGQPGRRIVRRKRLGRRRLERADERRPSGGSSVVDEPRENLAMAEMQPVERTDRDRPSVLGRR